MQLSSRHSNSPPSFGTAHESIRLQGKDQATQCEYHLNLQLADLHKHVQVALPIQNPTCCTFGGKDMDQLYVTSMKEEGKDASEHWGGVYRLHIPGEAGLAPAYKVKLP